MIWLLAGLGLMLFSISTCADFALAGTADAGASSSGAPKPSAKVPEQVAPAAPPAAPAKSGAATVAGQFGDWAMLCGDDAKDDKSKEKDKARSGSCSLVQQLVDSSSKKSVFSLTIVYGPRGNLILIVDAPLGVALDRGLEMTLGGQSVQREAFSHCLPAGCQTVLILTDALKEEMRKATEGFLTVYTLSGAPLRVAFSLKGLDEALSALDKRRSPS